MVYVFSGRRQLKSSEESAGSFIPLPGLDSLHDVLHVLESPLRPEAERQGRKTFLLWTGESKCWETRGCRLEETCVQGMEGCQGRKGLYP